MKKRRRRKKRRRKLSKSNLTLKRPKLKRKLMLKKKN